MQMHPLSIIVINYRTPKVTLDCLRSLSGVIDEVPGAQVILVDNGSGDDSVPILRREIEQNRWRRWVRLLALDDNTGFAGGNNRGIAFASPSRYYLLLNSDTLVDRGVLKHCYAMMEGEPSIGVMSCMLRNADGSFQNTARGFPSPARAVLCLYGLPWRLPDLFGSANVFEVPEHLQQRRRDCDWVGGAFMWLRGSMVERIGGMDEGFFFYGEDVELCFRARQAGYRVHYDPTVAITHLGGASSDPTRLSRKMRNRYTWEARYRIQHKCYGPAAAMAVWLADVVFYAARYVRVRLTGQGGDPERQLRREVLSVVARSAPPMAVLAL